MVGRRRPPTLVSAACEGAITATDDTLREVTPPLANATVSACEALLGSACSWPLVSVAGRPTSEELPSRGGLTAALRRTGGGGCGRWGLRWRDCGGRRD